MAKKFSLSLKIFLIVLFLLFLFWPKIEKNLQDLFFSIFYQKEIQSLLWQKIALEEKLESLKPIRNQEIKDLKIEAQSAISVFFPPQGSEKILFGKEIKKKLPIASLTKLMTANVVLENYDLSQEIKISKSAVEEEGDLGNLRVGESFEIKDLLYPLLMESSNDAAMALVEQIGEKKFLNLMNLKAKELAMENTHFFNATGLDPENSGESINYSTAEDLVKLAKYLLEKKPLVWEILAIKELKLESPKGVYHHTLKNNDKLLGEIPEIIAGKTGWTPSAGGCLISLLKAPKKGYLINILLGTKDREKRFEEMKKLINWLKIAYKW